MVGLVGTGPLALVRRVTKIKIYRYRVLVVLTSGDCWKNDVMLKYALWGGRWEGQ